MTKVIWQQSLNGISVPMKIQMGGGGGGGGGKPLFLKTPGGFLVFHFSPGIS